MCFFIVRFTQSVEDSSCCWIHGQRPEGEFSSSTESTVKDRIKDNSILNIPSQQGTNRDNVLYQRFSSGDYPGVQVKGSSESDVCITDKTGCDYGVSKGQTECERKTPPVETPDPNRSMLSSSMVTVLAPHWNSRLRRNKRFEGMNNPQGSLQDVTNTATNCSHEPFHRFGERSFTSGMQEPSKYPFVGTKGETDSWSTKSGPASLGSECKRKMIHTVSVDLNCQRINNRRMAAASMSSSPTALIPVASDDQKNNPETFKKTGLSSLSSKPTTSSILLSLRRFNSNSRISDAPSSLPDINQAPSERNAKLFPACPSQSIDCNLEAKSKPPFSPSYISCRTSEAVPRRSLPTSTHSERLKFETRYISASSENKDLENMPLSQHSQPTLAKSNLLHSKPTPQLRGLNGRDPNFRISNRDVSSESLSSAGLGSHKTTLTSTSWWKQVSQEGVSPLKLNETSSSKEKLNAPCAPPTNDNNNNNKDDRPSADSLYIKRFNSPISNRYNKNATSFFHKDSVNLVTKPQGGSQKLKQRISDDSHEPDSDQLSKLQNESKSNSNQPQSTPGVFPYSKIRRASEQTLSHPEDLTQDDASSFTPTPVQRNPESIDSPSESSSAYKANPSAFQNTSLTTSPVCADASIKPLHIQAIRPKTTNNLVLGGHKTDPTINIKPPSSTNNSHTPSHTRSSSQTSRFTPRGNASPLGFERSYDSLPKPHSRAAFSPIPTVRAFCKSDSGPVSNTAAVLSTTAKQPETAPSISPTTHSVTPVLMSHSSPIPMLSLLTPPPTPNITSPNFESCSPKESKETSAGQERDSEMHSSEGKRERRVTWEDSVDLQRSEPITVKILESPQVPTSSLSPSRSSPTIKAPSIFSILRSSSPSTNFPLSSPTSKTSSLQVSKREKHQSLSTDCADLGSRGSDQPRLSPRSPPVFHLKTKELPMPRQDRTVSLESDIVQPRLSSPLSLPPDFLSGYKLRYSSPPYSTLMSTRSTQGDSKPVTPRLKVFQQPLSYSPHLSKPADSVRTAPASKPPLLPVTSPQPPAVQYRTNHEDLNFGVSEIHQISNNNDQNNNQDVQDRNIFLVKNRVHISSSSLQGTKAPSSLPKCVTETLVYTVNTSKSSAPKPSQQAENTTLTVEPKHSQQSNKAQQKKPTREAGSISSGSSSTDSHSTDDRSSKVKDSALNKSRFFTVQNSSEQSPKKSRFALKRSESTPNPSLLQSDSERTNKTNNKVDQVLTRLRQTFSTRRSDDDLSFPWKWKRNSQTPFISGSSDISNVRDVPAETKAAEEPEQEKAKSLTAGQKETQITRKWTQEEKSVIPMATSGGTMATEEVLKRPHKLTLLKDQVQPIKSTEVMPENKVKSPTIQRPAAQVDFNKDTRTDYKLTNQLLICKGPSPERSSTSPTDCSPQFTKSTPSPRSPFSPFSSISPLSPFPSDVADDVFYSPKLQRRRDSPLPCDIGEGVSLRTPKRSQASTRPPSVSSIHNNNHSATLYADLKYGIEPGKSFSVSSVLSSRPSGPGRISTGSRFMSVGDLSNSTLTHRGTEDSESWSVSPDWTVGKDFLPSKESLISYFPSDPGKMKTRSLPRSLTRRLANWGSDVSTSPSVTMESTKPARMWSPNMNMTTFEWDIEGPPTPPPTPPLSPVSRPISKPPSSSSPTFPSSPGPPRVDSPSAMGHRPSRGYISSLSTFEESSDSSDTTTDDEYFLESSEGEKETEL